MWSLLDPPPRDVHKIEDVFWIHNLIKTAVQNQDSVSIGIPLFRQFLPELTYLNSLAHSSLFTFKQRIVTD